jgi:sugar lactone lactonase YvrE
MAISAPESIWALGAELGEGSVWVARDKALWFADIKGKRVHRFDPASGAKRSWDAPDQVGFVLPKVSGGFITGLKSGLHHFDPADGSFRMLVDPEPQHPNNRLNDGTVDPFGRLWFGTMDDAETAETGTIYRFEGERAIPATPYCAITNGPAFSPDGRICYHVNTLGGVVYACDVTGDGALTNRRIFATIDPKDGHPDGPTCDAEGSVWLGLFGGWAVRRYAPSGELLEVVQFPVANITKLAFGGDDLRTVFATTAGKGLSDVDRAAQPLAGDLFTFRADVPGVAGVEIKAL